MAGVGVGITTGAGIGEGGCATGVFITCTEGCAVGLLVACIEGCFMGTITVCVAAACIIFLVVCELVSGVEILVGQLSSLASHSAA